MTGTALWTPSAGRIDGAAITHFARQASARSGRALPDYASLWRWSTDDIPRLLARAVGLYRCDRHDAADAHDR